MCASVNHCNACINGRYTTDLIDLYLYAIDNLRDKLSNNNCFTLPECRSNFSQSPTLPSSSNYCWENFCAKMPDSYAPRVIIFIFHESNYSNLLNFSHWTYKLIPPPTPPPIPAKDYIGFEPILAPKSYYQIFGK